MFANGAATAAFSSLLSSAANAASESQGRQVDVDNGETVTVYSDDHGDYYIDEYGQKLYVSSVADNYLAVNEVVVEGIPGTVYLLQGDLTK